MPGWGGAASAARLSEDPNVSACLLAVGGEGRHLLAWAPAAVMANALAA